MLKFYAVKKGRSTGIFETWQECKDSINQYSGAVFQLFGTREEAEAYLKTPEPESELMPLGTTARTNPVENIVENLPDGMVVAYVDGSFNSATNTYAFGCVLLTPYDGIVEEQGSGNDPEYSAIWNVAGETLAAQFAVDWAVEHGYPEIQLRYDYDGIEKWVSGEWKAKNDITKNYAAKMKRWKDDISISFQKIKAHTGDYYNEKADSLAKAALAAS